jgi:hypothetical protein
MRWIRRLAGKLPFQAGQGMTVRWTPETGSIEALKH